MPTHELDHPTFRDQVDAFVAGALVPADAAAMTAHAAACPACAAALADAEAHDAFLRDAFAGARPRADLEDYLVARLRLNPQPQKTPWIHPAVRRAAVGVAAVVLLGGFGLVVTSAVERGGLPFPGAARRVATAEVDLATEGEPRNRAWFWGEAGEQAPGQALSPDSRPAAAPVDNAPSIQSPSDMALAYNRSLQRDESREESRWTRQLGESGTGASGDRRLKEINRAQTSPLSALKAGRVSTFEKGLKVGDALNGRTGETDVKLKVEDAEAAARRYGFRDNVGQWAVQPDGTVSLGSVVAGNGQAPNLSLQSSTEQAKPGGGGSGGGSVVLGRNAGGATFGAYALVPGQPGSGPVTERYARPVTGAAAEGVAVNGVVSSGGVAAAGDSRGGEAQLEQLAKQDANAAGLPVTLDAFRPDDFLALKKNAELDVKAELGVEREKVVRDLVTLHDAPADQQGQQQVAGEQPQQQLQQMQEQKQQGVQELLQAVPGVRAVETNTAAAAPAVAGEPVRAEPPANAAPAAGRKIIRNGEMSFEVDGFDSAYLQITKIAGEEGGFVATTDSEKLANGKVRGTVTVRVPPDRLDTMVLKLRALGDLKSSRLAASDITKQYTDMESQLRASRAMEERLLNIIKTGKGEIKDLVEAEKQLGVYREKIEQVEGEIRYYNNLVSLSTLNVTLTERDIRTASMLSETEQVNMGVEAVDVEKARAAAIQAIDEAKGRIVESDLKKLAAGQFAARVVADVPPDAAGPLIDRMKQIGTVARLEIERKQAAPEGTVAPAAPRGLAGGPRVERRETRFLISLYNLANVAPRQNTTLNLAAEDVEVAYRSILDQVKSAGGRVVTSQLNRPRPDQTTGTITFEAPTEGADVLLGAVRAAGEVMRLEVSQNPDAQNVTEAKRGFSVQVYSMAAVAPRETTSLRLAATGVADAFNTLREAVRATEGARVLSSQLSEQDPANVTGTLDFEVRRADWAAVETALRGAGVVVSRNVSRSADAENTVDTKVRLQVVLVDEAALQPRESVTITLAVADVPAQYAKLLEAAAAAQARVLQSQLAEQESRNDVTGTLVFDVRRDNRAALDRAMNDAGDVVSRSVVRSTDTQNTLDDKVRVSLTLGDADRLAPRETTTLGLEVKDVDRAKDQIQALAVSLGGRVVDSTLSREQTGRVMGKVVADVPLAKAMEMVQKSRDAGRVQFRRDARDENVPEGKLARARVDVTLANEDLLVESGQGLGDRIRDGLRTSLTGLLWSVQLIVVGLFLVAPWALIVWFGWKLFRRRNARRTSAMPTPA